MRRWIVSCLLLVPIAAQVDAQGMSGAAIHGTVRTTVGTPVVAADVRLRAVASGTAFGARTNGDGRFVLEHLPVGSGYQLTVRAVGYAPVTIDRIVLHLGDRLRQEITMVAARGQELATVMIADSALRDAGAGGAAVSVSGDAIRNLPLLNRDFVGLFGIAPQATGPSALSIGGQNVRFNAIQVDGASANDFYGTDVIPGRNVGARALSLEALDEIRILATPFDVRFGGFSGALINAVTRSGTNQHQRSTFASLTHSRLVGTDTASARAIPFRTAQYGVTFSGPIIRNRLHYFLTGERQSSTRQFFGAEVSDPATGITPATAQRVQQVLRDRYGYDPGGAAAPTLSQPTLNLFGKLSWQASERHRLELTGGWADADNEMLARPISTAGGASTFQLSSSGLVDRVKTLSARLKVTSAIAHGSNELLLSYGQSFFDKLPQRAVPQFQVEADRRNVFLLSGAPIASHGTRTDQVTLELVDNLSWSVGRHVPSIGTQVQLLRFDDFFFQNSWGTWRFDNVDALDRQMPSQYSIALPLRSSGPRVRMDVVNAAVYLQDRWNLSPRFAVTAGLRADVPFFLDHPVRNPTLAASSALGHLETDRFPSGNVVVSPRIGFAFEQGENRETTWRGGFGGFAGRPPFVWLAGAFANTGQEQTTLTCTPSLGVPPPVTDISRSPTRCLRDGPTSSAVSTINYVDPDFRFQQAWTVNAGVDRRFPGQLTVSLDLTHRRLANSLTVDDVNLLERGRSAEGRMLYGAPSSTGLVGRPARIDGQFGPIYGYDNHSRDRSTALALTVNKQWNDGAAIYVGYNWSRSLDATSVSGLISLNISRSNPVDGTLANRVLSRSARDVPHNVVLTAMAPVVRGFRATIFASARSGTPFAYTTAGDVNLDSIGSNDLLYVPGSPDDISLIAPAAFAALDRYIAGEDCLRMQRGRVMARNSCRNPFTTRLDARIAKTFSLGRAQQVELLLDVFNLPNLLNRQWGLVREATTSETLELLDVRGWDTARNRPLYAVRVADGADLRSPLRLAVESSRWRMQLGARYRF
ncbi:MAG: TonB-dependent receptor [Gemmatimonadota bacterium]